MHGSREENARRAQTTKSKICHLSDIWNCSRLFRNLYQKQQASSQNVLNWETASPYLLLVFQKSLPSRNPGQSSAWWCMPVLPELTLSEWIWGQRIVASSRPAWAAKWAQDQAELHRETLLQNHTIKPRGLIPTKASQDMLGRVYPESAGNHRQSAWQTIIILRCSPANGDASCSWEVTWPSL